MRLLSLCRLGNAICAARGTEKQNNGQHIGMRLLSLRKLGNAICGEAVNTARQQGSTAGTVNGQHIGMTLFRCAGWGTPSAQHTAQQTQNNGQHLKMRLLSLRR
jgi:hypothetical protein